MSRLVKDHSASVRSKLANLAKVQGRPFNEILQYYAIERFLYRLSKSEHAHKFVLKGALLFFGWGIVQRRPTRDIDLRGFPSIERDDVEKVFREICTTDVQSDGIIFDPETILSETILDEIDVQGIRVRFLAFLGTSRVHMQVDIGFTDEIMPSATSLEYPVLLDLPAPQVQGDPREIVVAEKLDALVSLGVINSRMKDFYDLFELRMKFCFSGIALTKAIAQTFQTRNTPIPLGEPEGLSTTFSIDKQINWEAFLRRVDQGTKYPSKFLHVTERLKDFLLPPLHAAALNTTFDATWEADGAWVKTE